MYEPIRTKSVHTMVDPEIPHRSREQELDIRLAGQLTALLTVTDELHALARRMESGGPQGAGVDGAGVDGAEPAGDGLHGCALDGTALAAAAERIAEQVARLSGGHYPLRAEPTDGGAPSRIEALQQRAHTLAGNALAVATTRGDEAARELAAERMAAHAAPLRDLATA
ncbi:SCO4983 family protein [Streptomyces tubercidicus]|uniref:SCO4983 family protein n=1 Tax=Streptomyces tubercidicus TaxID=47759 RepID=UPI0036CE5752